MRNAVVKYVDDEFYEEFGGGDGEDIRMCCPDCEGTSFELLDDEYGTVQCANPACRCVVSLEWLDPEDVVVEADDEKGGLSAEEFIDLLRSIGVDRE